VFLLIPIASDCQRIAAVPRAHGRSPDPPADWHIKCLKSAREAAAAALRGSVRISRKNAERDHHDKI
jgi:hypothetical protein